ncbi:MAG: hcaC [Herbaspirillum sp.]|jgi:nitrite reductase/ring-hydroxylating ferredoxin subunit|nr:hcaC [Herbaspirillum sp.]
MTSMNAQTDTSNAVDLLELCASTDVADNAALKVEKAGLCLAVFNLAGKFFVTDDLCTHGPGSLSEGYIDGDVIECDFHNGAFNIRTGEVVSPPCMTPLRTYSVHALDGKIYIDPDQPAFAADALACPKTSS